MCNRLYLHIENQATGKTRLSNVKDIVHEPPVELLNVDIKFLQSWKVYKSSSDAPHYPLKHRLKISIILWVISSDCEILGSAMTIISPDKATSTVLLQQLFHILRLFPACSATSRYFHLPPCYEDHTMMMNASLDMTNINAVNISTPDIRIWQHFNSK